MGDSIYGQHRRHQSDEYRALSAEARAAEEAGWPGEDDAPPEAEEEAPFAGPDAPADEELPEWPSEEDRRWWAEEQAGAVPAGPRYYVAYLPDLVGKPCLGTCDTQWTIYGPHVVIDSWYRDSIHSGWMSPETALAVMAEAEARHREGGAR